MKDEIIVGDYIIRDCYDFIWLFNDKKGIKTQLADMRPRYHTTWGINYIFGFQSGRGIPVLERISSDGILLDKYLEFTEKKMTKMNEKAILAKGKEYANEYKYCKLLHYTNLIKDKELILKFLYMFSGGQDLDCVRILQNLTISIPSEYHCSECENMTFQPSKRESSQ